MAARYGVRVWLALVTVYIVWGSTFIALAIAIRDLPPFLAMSIRHLVAGGVLLAFALPRGDRDGDPIGRRQIGAASSCSEASCSSPATACSPGHSRRCPGGTARRNHPDLDGSPRPRRVRKAPARARLCRHSPRIRRARLTVRYVRPRIRRNPAPGRLSRPPSRRCRTSRPAAARPVPCGADLRVAVGAAAPDRADRLVELVVAAPPRRSARRSWPLVANRQV